jgi:hypothetical protein
MKIPAEVQKRLVLTEIWDQFDRLQIKHRALWLFRRAHYDPLFSGLQRNLADSGAAVSVPISG